MALEWRVLHRFSSIKSGSSAILDRVYYGEKINVVIVIL
jgi:hypothetical protein